ncbi:MAG: ATP-binding protein [Oscillospiraceae bacterium]
MEDLITTPANRELMSLAISHIKYRIVVRDRWGMDKKNAYGRGVCILFFGPSGTGKTMAAQAMAHEIGMDLFRVDSSQLTSKYVGETSKNMRQIFDDARSSNTILFFDEADAIFGKRTDASDATGRYANGDTAFLLQKIEEYDGMVILSTNLLYNIDEAFRRRITYMVNFSMPDRELREQMWRSMIPEEMPTRELDFPFLSKYELTGSSIKSILISAAYMAASSEDVLDMRAVLRSVQIFMTKQGKHLAPNDLIPYDALLKF